MISQHIRSYWVFDYFRHRDSAGNYVGMDSSEGTISICKGYFPNDPIGLSGYYEMSPVSLWEPGHYVPFRIIRSTFSDKNSSQTDFVIRYWLLDIVGSLMLLVGGIRVFGHT
jgi:hypothetical protein